MADANQTQTREEALHYLSAATTHWGKYHNHKETSAWAAILLFVGFGTFLPKILELLSLNSCFEQLMASFVLLLFTCGVGIFTWIQYSLCQRAADLIHACLYLQVKYISSPDEAVCPDDFKPMALCAENENKIKTTHSHYTTPKAVENVCTIFKEKRVGRGPRNKLKRLAMCFILLIGIALIMMVWISKQAVPPPAHDCCGPHCGNVNYQQSV